MLLAAGTRFGPYEIVSLLGAGGMGEVYLARDSRLDRQVALKVLPSHLSGDIERRERFQLEARVISSLSHPHICSLFDIGQQGGDSYLVMEYVEGQSLAERMSRGPLPINQVLRYAREIADALDAAHQHAIIHRDLKPSNIMLTKSGAKLLDFGLAKLRSPQVIFSELSPAPTDKQTLTAEGTIVGTCQYMAPEQLEGKEADARSDIFAFGAVVYEMATGRKAFQGHSKASLIAAILATDPPPISALQPTSPSALDHVIGTCLAKDPQDRWQTAHDLASELRWIAENRSQTAVSLPLVARPANRERLAWMAAALVLVVLLALSLWRRPPPAGTSPIRFSVSPPDKSSFTAGSISPDGSRLAFIAATSDGKSQLWIRPLDSLAAQALPGTEGASDPFWSPDSRFIGFFTPEKLKKIEISSGSAQTLCDAPAGSFYQGRGGTWNSAGTIVFARSTSGGLYQVSAGGGSAVPVTKLSQSRQEQTHRWPSFLPDGRHFLYLALGGPPDQEGIYLGSLDSEKTERLMGAILRAAYAPPGYLLFARERTLLAQPFDPKLNRITGEAFSIASQVAHGLGGWATFSVSQNGVLAYGSARSVNTQLVWFDRTGKRLQAISAPGEYRCPELSPNQARITVELRDPQMGTHDIWLIELSRGTTSRFTFDPSDDSNAVWAPDGRRILFSSNKKGHRDICLKLSTGSGGDEVVFASGDQKNVDDLSADGRYVVYTSPGPTTGNDLWVLPLFGDRKPIPFLRTPFNEVQGQISPDGRWLAYASNESGSLEVYVQPFPLSGTKSQISTGGGAQPRWRRDGRELFYLAPDGKLMAVEIRGGSAFGAGLPKALFEPRVTGLTNARNHYDVTADGRRFLVNTRVEEPTALPINVVINWTSDLRK